MEITREIYLRVKCVYLFEVRGKRILFGGKKKRKSRVFECK